LVNRIAAKHGRIGEPRPTYVAFARRFGTVLVLNIIGTTLDLLGSGDDVAHEAELASLRFQRDAALATAAVSALLLIVAIVRR
jgi:hypothetical protein